MVLHTPPGDAGFSISGARVATGTSTSGGSVTATPLHARPGTKLNEVWATAGYGQIVDPSRCKRIKRSFKRACKRAFHTGCTQYRGRDFWYSGIPFRIRQQLTKDLKAPSPKTIPEHQQTSCTDTLKVFCWNASNGLQFDEWVDWSTQSPYDIILLQETGSGTCCIHPANGPQLFA